MLVFAAGGSSAKNAAVIPLDTMYTKSWMIPPHS